MSHERRQHTRIPVDIPARYQIAGQEQVETRIVDMSPGGANMLTGHSIPFGTRMRLEVDLPEMKATVKVDATVRWDGPGATGVQFGMLGAKDTYLVTEFLARRTSKAGGA